jgi:broad specificity phosphatase PhoE
MKFLIVYRHGERSDEAPLHRQVDFQCVSDAPLTEVGHEQAEFAASSIFSMIPEGSTVHLVSSPLIRCLQTSVKLARKLKIPIFVEEGFGECYCQHHFPINPFENLHIRVRPEMFSHTLEGVEIVENDHKVRPNNPESLEELHERMDLMMKEYILTRQEDFVVICTHFLPVKWITKNVGGKDELLSQHTIITAAQLDGGDFRVIREGCFEHLPETLRKPILR